MQTKILDTDKLAAAAEEFASLDPNYWQKSKNKDQSQSQKHDKGGNNANVGGKNRFPKRPHNTQQNQHNKGESQNRQNDQRFSNQAAKRPQNESKGQGQGQQNQPNKRFKGNQNSTKNTNTGAGNSYSVNRCSQLSAENSRPTHQCLNKDKFIIPGVVQGQKVEIFRDSGCDNTAVNSKLVPEYCYTGNTVKARGIHGQVDVPTANIHIECDRFQGDLEVLVIEDLDYQVLLGTEVDTWDDLNQPTDLENSNILVLTRAQKQQQVHKEIIAQDDIRDYTNVKSHDNKRTATDTTNCNNNTQIDDDVKNLLEGDVQRLIELQNHDPTLTTIRASMVQKQSANNIEYYRHTNGLIMRKCQPGTRLRKQIGDQIVLPQQYRQHIILIAHDKSGHLGIQKTKDRITQHFYWPNINHDIRDHCQTCEQCQFMSKGKQSNRLLLRPLPIVDTPFKRVGIDIKGPLPVTEQGNKYILVVCDYATRYPEAIPISDQKADTVAQAMLEIFSRTGLPTEIIHDRGTQFMSKVMSNMCGRLGISQIPATPYHQQTNGLTERFIGTLSAMISSLDQDCMENWDRQLPLFLFSYREVPSEFTGYSPFHLMYGRQIRGPLDLIKQGYLQEEEGQDIPSRLLDMSAKITTWLANARVKKVQNQKKMKANYDKKARDREFKKGDKVLVFLPEGGGKFESKWQGPYFITKKVGEVNYEVEMPDKKKSHRILHANMIKRFYDRQQATNIRYCYCVTGTFQELEYDQEYQADEFDTEYLDQNIGPTYTQTQTWKDAKIDDTISTSQFEEIQQLLSSHEKVFSDVPGKTHVITHKLVTTTDAPIRQRAYRTPQAIKSKVQDEIDNMLNLGVIEEINSSYASPIVAVNKPNGDIRLCTNYKALNKVTVVDPYEMPRIDEILEDVAHAQFISTLDLTKGFYQVPLDPQAKAKSAFVAFGRQYAYNVMPFGMVNSSATFQRLVDEVLRDCNSFCRQYIDDVAIFSNSWQEHLEHLDTVLTKIHEAGLTVKPSKCKFAHQQVTYLGHTVGNGQIKPNVDKIKAVMQFPKPVTKKDVRSFLGLTGYYRKFVNQYEDIARPLIDLTKKKEPKNVVWTPLCESAFQNLKAYLST